METINERLEIYEEFGAVVTYTFPENKYIRTAKQEEDVVVPHRHPIASIDLSKAWFDDDFSAYLLDFFTQVKGTQKGFRFRDPLDWEATKDPLVINGTSTQGKLGPTPNGVITDFQLFKVYKIGIEAEIWRPITRPTEDIFVYIDGVTTDFTLNTATGVVTFDDPPVNGAILTWRGIFDIPVRFETDEGFSLQTIVHQTEAQSGTAGGRTLFSVPSLKLVEIKEKSIPVFYGTFPSELNHTFEVDVSYGANISQNFYGQKEVLDSGFEDIKSQSRDAKTIITGGTESLIGGDNINYLITLFRCSMGAASLLAPDYYVESLVKIRLSNSISMKVERDSSVRRDQLFRISRCELVGTANRTYHVFGTYYSKGGPYIDGNFICNGACNQTLYFRTIDPVPSSVDLSFVVGVNGLWYIKDAANFLYLVDFIYPNNYFARDLADTRGYPIGPFSPHGIGITYVPSGNACVQNSFESTACGDNLVITDIVLKG